MTISTPGKTVDGTMTATDDIFFTSNESVDAINQMLDEANRFHPNIKLVRQLSASVSFLDVYIENNNGTLVTSVYHK
jgi:hypothetical protein